MVLANPGSGPVEVDMGMVIRYAVLVVALIGVYLLYKIYGAVIKIRDDVRHMLDEAEKAKRRGI